MFLREKKCALEPLSNLPAFPNVFKDYLSTQGRNLILVLGPTGSGVSTFVNYMAGCQMESKLHNGDEVVEVQAGTQEICKTSHTCGSETVHPQVVVANEGIELLDCPAFDFNGEAIKKAVSVVSTPLAITQANEIHGMVIMVSYNDFKNSRTFHDLMCSLNNNMPDLLKYEQSILFLVTHAPEKIKPHHILFTLNQHAEFESLFHKSGTHLQQLYNLAKHSPAKVQLFNPLDENQRALLSEQLRLLTPIPKSSFNFSDFDKWRSVLCDHMKNVIEHLNELINKRQESDRIIELLERYKIGVSFISNNANILNFDEKLLQRFMDLYEKNINAIMEISPDENSSKSPRLV